MPRTPGPWSSFHAPSASSSRASSPTRGLGGVAGGGSVPVSRSSTHDTTTPIDPLEDYFTNHPNSHGSASQPVTPYSDMWGGSAGAQTPGVHGPVEIVLDSENLTLRGYGSEFNSAYLSGRVELFLSDSTNVKEINMTLVGKARVQFHDNSG